MSIGQTATRSRVMLDAILSRVSAVLGFISLGTIAVMPKVHREMKYDEVVRFV